MNISALQEKIVGYEADIEKLMAGEPTEDGLRAADRLTGKLEEARASLMDEARRIQEENAAIRAAAAEGDPSAMASFAERVLGPRASFAGVQPGWKVTVAAAVTPMKLGNPERTDYNLPAPGAAPMGVLDTIPTGVTDGDERYFKSPVLTNKAAGWVTGAKPESSVEWTEDIAHLETIAHHMPIAKLTARRYAQLEGVVGGALMLGLAIKKDEYVVRGSNSNGIVGLKNQTGILTYTKDAAENVYDAAVNMRARARVASGLTPDCVALPSAKISQLKTLKGSDGHYLYPEIVQNGTLDGMRIVEDENLAVTTEGAQTATKHGMLVYFSGAAQFNVADPDELTVGLVNAQFIENAYTLLAEGTYALKVPFPAAVCYCESV